MPAVIHHEDGFNEDEAKGLKRERRLYRRLALGAGLGGAGIGLRGTAGVAALNVAGSFYGILPLIALIAPPSINPSLASRPTCAWIAPMTPVLLL